MDREDITEGLKVRLLGPEGHPLYGAAGTVIRVFTADEMWHQYPVTMMGDPFAWLNGQVRVSLDFLPYDNATGRRWTPVVSVAPQDVEDPSLPPASAARVKLRELLASYAAARRVVTETTVRAELDAHGFEVDRSTLHGWLLEEAAWGRPDGAP